MKHFTFSKLNRKGLIIINILALLIAITIAAVALGIKVNPVHKEIHFKFKPVKSPLLYGKWDYHFAKPLRAKMWNNDEYHYSSLIPPYSKTILVPSNLYQIVATIKSPWEKATSNMISDNVGKRLVGLKNKYLFTIHSDAFITNKKTYIHLGVLEEWNPAGTALYSFAGTQENVVQGSGKAQNYLFNGLIDNGADLTKWYFAKTNDLPKANGTDAELAIIVNAQTGEISMLNKNPIPSSTNFKITIVDAYRTTSL